MTWSEAGDILHRWAAVPLLGIGLFRFSFEVAIWPSLLLLLSGAFVVGTLRRRFFSWWVLGVALVMAGLWGFYATIAVSNWSDMIRPEPFGQMLLGLYIFLGSIALRVAFKKRHS